MTESSFKKYCVTIFFLLLILIIAVAMNIGLGSTAVNWSSDLGLFIIRQVRIPRCILAILVGMSLSLAGAVFQALFRNPLADPHLLGISAGGALGVVIGSGVLAGGLLVFSIPMLSVIGSLVTMVLVYRLSLRKGALSLYTLLLVGVMLNSLFVAMIIFVQSLVRSDELITVLFWLIGQLTFANPMRLAIVATIFIIVAILVLKQAKKLNILSLGEATAFYLGVNVERIKKILFFLAALLTGVVVSVSGMIGFVGLVVPHIARLMVGSDYRRLLPACILIGAIVLVLSDLIARTILAPQELPVGVITSFLGAPFFIYLLKRREAKRIL